MRVLNVVSLLVLVAALACAWVFARRGEDGTTRSLRDESRAGSAAALFDPAPVQVFANAKVGDWYAFTYANRSSLANLTGRTIATVAAADADRVTLQFAGRIVETGESRTGTHTQRRTQTLDQLLDHADWRVFDVTITDEDRTVGGRTFHCKKLVYSEGDPMFPKKKTHVEHWISPEVVGGLVERHETQDLEALRFDMRMTIIGFGSGSATTWGTRPTGE
jgi:hypothetical protein